MIVRELLTLLGFTVDKASYDKAKKAYDSLQGKMTQQGKVGQTANAQLQQQGKAAQDAAKGTGMLGDALGMMQRFAAQAGLSHMLMNFTELASSADETQNVIKQLFGEKALGEVTDWSEKMGEAMGRSKYSLQQYASTLGAVIQPIAKSDKEAQAMAQSLAELSVDLGSFFNTSDEDAMRALRSGLTGEYESLKKYGVVLNDATLQEIAHTRGITKKVSKMSIAEKTELRYQAILARTERVTGDAIRTGDGFANSSKAIKESLKDLGTEMAKTVLPKLEKFIRFGRDALKWFNKTAKGTHLLETAMYALAAVAGILAAEFYGVFVVPALALGALILLVDDLWTTLEGGESVTRDIIDSLFGEGTTAQVVAWIKNTFGPLMAELDKLDARGIWETFSAGVDNAGFAMEKLIEKVIRLLSWLHPTVAAFRLIKKAGQSAGLVDEDIGRAMAPGMDAPIADGIADELSLRMAEQSANIARGVADRQARRKERAREEQFGPRQYSAVPTMAEQAAGYGVLAMPAAGDVAPAAAAGGAPTVNLAAPTIIINGGDPAMVKRVVTETMEGERKKTMAAVGRRGRS